MQKPDNYRLSNFGASVERETMGEFLNRLESVKNKAVEVTSKMVEVTDTFNEFVNAFDGLYSYCMEAHEAKAKQRGKPSEMPGGEEHPLLAAYNKCD